MLSLTNFMTVIVLGITVVCGFMPEIAAIAGPPEGEWQTTTRADDRYRGINFENLFSTDNKHQELKVPSLLDVGIYNFDQPDQRLVYQDLLDEIANQNPPSVSWSDSKYWNQLPSQHGDIESATKKYFDGISLMEDALKRAYNQDVQQMDGMIQSDPQEPITDDVEPKSINEESSGVEWERKYEELKGQNAMLLSQVSEMKKSVHDRGESDLVGSERQPQVSGNDGAIPLVVMGVVMLLVIIAVAIWQIFGRNNKEATEPEVQNKSRSASLEEVIVMDATPNVSPDNSKTTAEIRVTMEQVSEMEIPDQIR